MRIKQPRSHACREVAGCLLRATGGGFWGWDSFKSKPYICRRSNSEVFSMPAEATLWAEKHNIGTSAYTLCWGV